jgi:hypothetical protein
MGPSVPEASLIRAHEAIGGEADIAWIGQNRRE